MLLPRFRLLFPRWCHRSENCWSSQCVTSLNVSFSADGDYIDLTENPERFTGYSGPSAHRVWASIYEENCFGISERSLHQPISEGDLLGLDVAGKEDKHLCEEKRVYYRIISGERIHATPTSEPLTNTYGRIACFDFSSHLSRWIQPEDWRMGKWLGMFSSANVNYIDRDQIFTVSSIALLPILRGSIISISTLSYYFGLLHASLLTWARMIIAVLQQGYMKTREGTSGRSKA